MIESVGDADFMFESKVILHQPDSKWICRYSDVFTSRLGAKIFHHEERFIRCGNLQLTAGGPFLFVSDYEVHPVGNSKYQVVHRQDSSQRLLTIA